MTLATKTGFTPEEYLALERAAEFKSEYVNGEIFAMAGATREYNLIAANVLAGLHGQLTARPCEVYGSDMRVQVSDTGLYTYPDVVAVCGGARFEDEHRDTLLNPSVLVEVLSPTTESYDRGEKFAHYRRLASLQDYVLIAQDKVRVEHFARQGGQWLLTEASDVDGTIHLAAIGCTLALRDVYAKVDLAFGAMRAPID